MLFRSRLLALTVLGMLACDGNGTTNPTPVTPVLLKDVVIQNLPSPFYHFDYDAAGRVRAVSFASQTTNDSVAYDGDQVTELHNSGPGKGNRLEYVYDDSARVSLVKFYDTQSVVYELNSLSWKGKQLVGLERDRKAVGGFVIDKTMSFTYYADGNLKDIVDHRPFVQDYQTESTTTDHFEDYDNGVNVDGFTLLHNDYFDHFVFIPGLTLQRGNPRKETFTGGSEDYVVTFTYAYDSSGRPVAKLGELTMTSGSSAGQAFQTLSTFTYY